MVVIVTGGSTSLLRLSLTTIQPMLVAIRVIMLFIILQYRDFFGCQIAVKAYPTGSTLQGKVQHRSTKFPTINSLIAQDLH